MAAPPRGNTGRGCYFITASIHCNPVRRGLIIAAEEHLYSSARAEFELDGFPQRLKPIGVGA
jgi:hypothetical protein